MRSTQEIGLVLTGPAELGFRQPVTRAAYLHRVVGRVAEINAERAAARQQWDTLANLGLLWERTWLVAELPTALESSSFVGPALPSPEMTRLRRLSNRATALMMFSETGETEHERLAAVRGMGTLLQGEKPTGPNILEEIAMRVSSASEAA